MPHGSNAKKQLLWKYDSGFLHENNTAVVNAPYHAGTLTNRTGT
jgi:hypothetical protein